jgi:hypothetical protein
MQLVVAVHVAERAVGRRRGQRRRGLGRAFGSWDLPCGEEANSFWAEAGTRRQGRLLARAARRAGREYGVVRVSVNALRVAQLHAGVLREPQVCRIACARRLAGRPQSSESSTTAVVGS